MPIKNKEIYYYKVYCNIFTYRGNEIFFFLFIQNFIHKKVIGSGQYKLYDFKTMKDRYLNVANMWVEAAINI